MSIRPVSWDHDDSIEMSMRFLRGGDIAEAQQESFNPPLVMTVRDPRDGDQIEVRRNVISYSVKDADDQQPYAFAAGTRRDLLGDPDWFASAIMRHLSCLLTGDAALETAQQQLTIGRVQYVIRTILSGLGYRVEIHKGQANVEDGTEVRAWPQESAGEMPAVQIDLVKSVTRLYCYLFGEPEPAIRPAAVCRVRAMGLSDQWVREGCRPDSPLLPLVHAALVRSYAALLAAVHH